MDSTGRMYASTPGDREAIQQALLDKTERVGDTAELPPGSIGLSEAVVPELTRMNRRCRRIFFSARRAGLSESQALDRARAGLPR